MAVYTHGNATPNTTPTVSLEYSEAEAAMTQQLRSRQLLVQAAGVEPY